MKSENATKKIELTKDEQNMLGAVRHFSEVQVWVMPLDLMDSLGWEFKKVMSVGRSLVESGLIHMDRFEIAYCLA